jgi:hypothetical protein
MKINSRAALTASCVALVCCLAYANASAGLILYTTLEDAGAIQRPEVAITDFETLSEAVPGLEHVSFEPGRVGTAARVDATGFYNSIGSADGPFRIHGDNIDFADPDKDGGRLDIWVRFDEDPHATTANTWLARSNYGVSRYVNYEWSSSGGTADMMIDMYSDITQNHRTSYEKFRVSPRGWSVYEDIREGEWHCFTFLWRNNGGEHKDEIHLFIDGAQAGCQSCSDFNGNLPPAENGVTALWFSPPLEGNFLKFSVDEIYAFDSWNFDDLTGNFPDLEIPEGIVMKYPQLNQYPVWGNPVPRGDVDFEFTVNNDVNDICECDLYIDGNLEKTVTAASGAHVEVTPNAPVPMGDHTWQVICDEGRIVGPVHTFHVEANVPVKQKSFGGTKRSFRQR